MHLDRRPQKSGSRKIQSERIFEHYGGEAIQHNSGNVGTFCIKMCGNLISGRSCENIILIDEFPTTNPENLKCVYAVVDEQSNRSLISTNLQFLENVNRTFCHHNLVFQHNMDDAWMDFVSNYLMDLIHWTCLSSLNTTLLLVHVMKYLRLMWPKHIHTCIILHYQYHLLDYEAKIELLIGRDIPQVHHVFDQVIGDKGKPFAQRLLFGWVIISEVCIGQVHALREVNVLKTQILTDGHCTTFPLWPYNISIYVMR